MIKLMLLAAVVAVSVAGCAGMPVCPEVKVSFCPVGG